jgi:hypothetical protein
VDVLDVRVDPGDEVTLQHVQALPQGLAFAVEAAVLGQDLLVHVHGHAVRAGDGYRVVGGTAVDHHQLVEQRVALDQLAQHRLDDRADGLRLV